MYTVVTVVSKYSVAYLKLDILKKKKKNCWIFSPGTQNGDYMK